jgi:predicted transcriptional regulator
MGSGESALKMTKRRRNRLEIVRDVLKSIQNKGGTIKPTHLLYKSNLSHNRLKEYLEELSQKRLIDEVEQKGKSMITLTQEGYEFLEKFDRLREFTDAFGL